MQNNDNNLVKNNNSILFVFVIFVAFVLLHLPVFFNLGFNGADAWRQSDTAAVARNFATEGMNIFYPRIDRRGALTGITGMEFPIYNYILAIVYKITGVIWTGWGKLISLFFAFSNVLILRFLLIKPRIGKLPLGREVLFFLVALCVPFFFRESAKVLPEFLSMLCVVSSLFVFYFYKTYRNFFYLFISTFLLLMGILIRPYYAMYGLPLLIDVCICFFAASKLVCKGYNKPFFYGFCGLFFGLGILVLFCFWYFYWVPYLNNHYGISYFYMGDPVRTNLAYLFSSDLILKIFHIIARYYLGYALLPFILYGFYLVKINRKNTSRGMQGSFDYLNFSRINDMSLIAVFTVIVVILVSGKQLWSGSTWFYYLGGIYPAILIWVYIGMVGFYEKYSNVKIIFLFFVIFVALAIIFFKVSNRQSADQVLLLKQKSFLLKNVKKDDLIVSPEGGSPVNLYLLNRKGFVSGWSDLKTGQNEIIKKYKSLGAKYILLKRGSVFFMKPLK